MSSDIYDNVIETERTDSERVEIMVDIYESADCVKDQDLRTETQQPLQNTGSDCVKMRRSRSALVCLALLCFLLLAAVIVLCVLIYTNNTNYTHKRNQLLTRINNITEASDDLLTKNTNLKEERDDLLSKLQKLDGWIYFQSSFYLISSEKKNWTESRKDCTERGADLIIINNREEQDHVNKISNSISVWIGLTDSDEEGRWKWVDGSNVTSGLWGSGEPNGYGTENCAVSFSSGWADYRCTRNFQWICEKIFLT